MIKQGPTETFKSYLARINAELDKMNDVLEAYALYLAMAGLHMHNLLWSEIQQYHCCSMSKFLRCSKRFIRKENTIEALTLNNQSITLGAHVNQVTSLKKNDKRRNLNEQKHLKKQSEQKKFRAEEVKDPKPFISHFTHYTELSNTLEQVLLAIKTTIPFRHPPPIKKDIAKRGLTKFYRFHMEVGPNTNNCFNLKKEIEDVIRRWSLREYILGQRVP